MKYTLPNKEKIIFNILCQKYETYIVGGAVRDLIFGATPKDWDFATIARPEEIIELFSGRNRSVDLVGANFGVVIVDGVEIATFRGDKYYGGGDKDVKITYVDTIEEDLARRDFTINAMALSLHGFLTDPFGGYDDLMHNPTIRFVGNAEDRINEDPNRILRAFRFSALLGYLINYNDMNSIRDNKEAIKKIAPERVRLEIMKTMETVKMASWFWENMNASGVLDIILPELSGGINHPHGEYHDDDVWTHNMITGDAVSTLYPLIKLSGYMHDIGKPASYDEDKGSFHSHEQLGADTVRKFMRGFKFSSKEIRKVVNLVLVHMNGTRGMTDKARRRLKKKLNDYGIEWREYVRLRIADRTGNTSRKNFTISEINDYIKIFTTEDKVPFSVNDLAMTGGDIIWHYNLIPGPIVGKIQRHLFEYVLEYGDDVNNWDYLTEEADIFLRDKL